MYSSFLREAFIYKVFTSLVLWVSQGPPNASLMITLAVIDTGLHLYCRPYSEEYRNVKEGAMSITNALAITAVALPTLAAPGFLSLDFDVLAINLASYATYFALLTASLSPVLGVLSLLTSGVCQVLMLSGMGIAVFNAAKSIFPNSNLSWLQAKLIKPKTMAQLGQEVVETAHEETRDMAKRQAIDTLKKKDGETDQKDPKSEARRASTENGSTGSELGGGALSAKGAAEGVQELDTVATRLSLGGKAVSARRRMTRGLLTTIRGPASAKTESDLARESKHLAGKRDDAVEGDLVFWTDQLLTKPELEPPHDFKKDFSSEKSIYPVVGLPETARVVRTPGTRGEDPITSLYYRVPRVDTSLSAGASARTLDSDSTRIFTKEDIKSLLRRGEHHTSQVNSHGSSNWEGRVLHPSPPGPGIPKSLGPGNRSVSERVLEVLYFAPWQASSLAGSKSGDSRSNFEVRADVGFTDAESVFTPHSPTPPELLSPISNPQQRRYSFVRGKHTSADATAASAETRAPTLQGIPTHSIIQEPRTQSAFVGARRKPGASDLPLYSHLPTQRVSVGAIVKDTTSSSGSSG